MQNVNMVHARNQKSRERIIKSRQFHSTNYAKVIHTNNASNGHDSWSLKVIRCCVNRRGIYDFVLALNSNINFRSQASTVLEISRLICIVYNVI